MKTKPKTKEVREKPVFEIKVNNWNRITTKEQDKALFWIYRVIAGLHVDYRKFGIADDFTGQSYSLPPTKKVKSKKR